jgi:hypothetical protein
MQLIPYCKGRLADKGMNHNNNSARNACYNKQVSTVQTIARGKTTTTATQIPAVDLQQDQ